MLVILSALELREGSRLPRFYGVAWAEEWRHTYVCLPVPFNIIARRVREFWHRLQLPVGRDLLEDCWRDGYNQGNVRGYRQGKEAGLSCQLIVTEIRAELAELKTTITASGDNDASL